MGRKLKSNELWEAYKEARDELFPVTDTNESNWVSYYYASKTVLDEYLSIYQLQNLAKKGVVRINKEDKVFLPDIKLINILKNAVDSTKKVGLIAHEKDYRGNDIIAVYPLKKMNQVGKTDFQHDIETVMEVYHSDFIQNVLHKYTDKVSRKA